MATKAKRTAPRADEAEAFNLRVVALDGLLRVAAKLADDIENAGTPDGFGDMDRELNAIWGVLPVLADALSSYGPGRYDRDHDMGRPVGAHLDTLAAMVKLADLKRGGTRGN